MLNAVDNWMEKKRNPKLRGGENPPDQWPSSFENVRNREIMSMQSLGSLKLLHQVLPDSPHTCPFSVDVHGNRQEHTTQLDTAEG